MELLEDAEGILWIGSRGGLLRFDPGRERFEKVGLGPGSDGRDLEITALAEDENRRLWVAQGAKLYVAEEDGNVFRRVVEVGSRGHRLTEVILEIEISPSGDVWLLVGDPAYQTTMVARLTAGGTLERFPLSNEKSFGRVFHFDSRGGLWLSAVRGSTNIPGAHPLPGGIPPSVGVHVMAEGADGTVWLGTMGDGLYRLSPDDPAALMHDRLGSGWQDNYILDLLVDRAGSVWVSTLAGVWRHDPGARPFRHLGTDVEAGKGLDVQTISSVLEGKEGKVWIGTFGGGIYRWQPETGEITSFRHDAGNPGSLCDDTIWAMHLDDSGTLWVGGSSSLCRLNPETGVFEPVALPRAWDRPPEVRALGRGGEGVVLVGFSVLGLWALDARTGDWSLLAAVDGQLSSLQVVSDAEAWIGFHTGLLVRVDPVSGRSERFELRGDGDVQFSDLMIYDIHRDGDGRLWLATDGGLGRFDPRSRRFQFPIAAGTLPGSVCFSLEPDAAGRLWVGTNSGLASIDRDPTGAQQVRVFDLKDGLGNIEFNRNAAFRSGTGEMFFGGMTGLTVFRPEDVRTNLVPPPVVLTRVSVLGKGGEREFVPRGMRRLTLEPTDQALAFEFAALNFIAPEKNRYAYRLDGLDADWVESEGRRFARYAGLAPGEYVFRVRGSNNHGVWSDKEATLGITVQPAFWQTIWFRGAGILIILGILYLLHRARVGRLLELEKVRLRIASDLHDELSGELSSIALSSAIARRQGYLQEPERRRLAEIESTSRQVVGGLRDLVWTINPEHDSLEAMVRRMRSTAAQFLEELDWSFEESWTTAEGGVAMTVRRDLHLVFKEALTNVVRHARATRVAIRLDRVGDRLRLEVEDDGVGFDPAAARSGTGLASMRRRAERLGAKLDIRAAPDRGTRLRLDLPVGRIRRGGETS
jgi:ligand-binding sensor domain-containing protein/anti-sigma regulatory factor (Ser/Thr protein kinase)